MLLRLVLVGSWLAAGCTGSTDTSSAGGALGDSAAEAETSEAGSNLDGGSGDEAAGEGASDGSDGLAVFPAQFVNEGVAMRMLAEGDPVDLWNAPQGGHVVLLGAKVRNLTSDTATIHARFRRPDTGLIVAEEGRTVKMVPVPDEPGMMQPDLRSFSQVANVPLCPSYGGLGIVDEAFDVELGITALYTDPVESGETKFRVVARCSTPEDEAFCRCDCGPNYFLGKCPGFSGDAAPGTRGSDAGPSGP